MSGPCPAVVDAPARVRQTVEVAAGFFLTRLEVPEAVLETRPGQFLQLLPRPADGFSPYLRIPMSVAAVDRGDGTVDVIYDLIGQKTWALSRWPAGGTIGCLGPIGNSFPEPGREERAVLVGGGDRPAAPAVLRPAAPEGRPHRVSPGGRPERSPASARRPAPPVGADLPSGDR